MTKTKKKPQKEPVIDVGSLNPDQRAAFDKLCDFLTFPDDSIYVIKGWAGTGKTYCVSLFVKYALEIVYANKNWYRIAVTGPTNKSVRVIKKTSGIRSTRVTFQTIHKLLGLKEKITMDGKQEFVNDGDFKPGIASTRLLIIDEVSMLNDDLFEKILQYRGKTKIICMGDPAQIPPVGRPDCIPFRDELAKEYKIRTLELRTVMRQKEGNAIIDSSVMIRSDLGSPSSQVEPTSVVNEKGEGVEFLNLNSEEVRKSFSKRLEGYFKSPQFSKDSEYAKIIAWRNKTVATMNDLIRSVIYGEESKTSKILKGEKLIANNPIIQDGNIVLNTNDEFSVVDYSIKTESPRFMLSKNPDDDPVEITLKYYDTKVSYLNDNDEEIQIDIEILHEDSGAEFRKFANVLRLKAIEKKGADKSWLHYYNFLRRYADVSYSYSITAHKSQGSTYNTTFVLEDDINMNLDVVERNRIKYTAYTRASKKVYVLRRF
jgi:exodeoxyribonuclease-5